MDPTELIIWTCVIVFILTAVMTVLHVSGVRVLPNPEHGKALFKALILEIVVICIAAFSTIFQNGNGFPKGYNNDEFSPVLGTKPVAYYSFDTTYNLGLDDSGNGKNGIIEGVSANIGIRNSAACFDGNSKIIIEGFKNFTWGAGFSVSIWFKRTGQWGNYQGIINNGYSTSGSWEIRMGRENNGTFLGGGVITTTSPQTWDYQGLQASPNEWHHVVMTHDGKHLLYYLDSQEKTGKSKVMGDILIKNTPVTIGQAGIGIDKEYFYGCIDEAAIYDRALSKDEIVQLFKMKNS
jgi:hypothetical protein